MKQSNHFNSAMTRRDFTRKSLMLGGLCLLAPRLLKAEAGRSITLPFERGHRPLAAFPQKRPLMVMTTRPPQLETPFHMFNESTFTPNDAFFVRWHLANIPTTIDINQFRLTIHGRVQQPLSLSLDDLKRDFEAIEIAAVCQCAGNSRGFFHPRVPGGQWGNGAMGNALWTGIRLRDILERAGLQADAQQIRFDGLDQPVSQATPDFKKSLPINDALRDQIIIAYAMNGEPLPYLNGFPLRLVVPGWYATYWVKMLNDIEVLSSPDDNFWTAHAYKIPADPCACVVNPGESPNKVTPIGQMTVRSFITNYENGSVIPGGKPTVIKGIAFDQGYGIDQVLVSFDGGQHWQATRLGKDHGDFSFRQWELSFTPAAGKHYEIQNLAINRIGESQRTTPRWNPSGYMRNVIETLQVKAV